MQTLEAIDRSRIIQIEDQIHEKKHSEISTIEISLEDLEAMLLINKNLIFYLDDTLKLFIQ